MNQTTLAKQAYEEAIASGSAAAAGSRSSSFGLTLRSSSGAASWS